MLTLHQKLYISKKVTCVPVLQQSSHSAHTADTLVSQRFSNPFIQFGTREITSKWHIAAVLSCSFYLSPCAICSFWCAPTHFLVLQILLKKKKKPNTRWSDTASGRSPYYIDQPLAMAITIRFLPYTGTVCWISCWGKKRQRDLHIFYTPLKPNGSCSQSAAAVIPHRGADVTFKFQKPS